jgi:hypothetical protein
MDDDGPSAGPPNFKDRWCEDTYQRFQSFPLLRHLIFVDFKHLPFFSKHTAISLWKKKQHPLLAGILKSVRH